MRILAVTHSLGMNGAARCLCELLVSLKAGGAEVDVVYVGAEPGADHLRGHGVRVLANAATTGYDVGLVGTMIDHNRVAELAGSMPVVFWVLEGRAMLDLALHIAPQWKSAFELSTRVVFQTRWQPDRLFASFLQGVAPHRVVAVAPYLMAPPAGPQRPAGGRPDAQGRQTVLHLGSVYPRKRPADIVQALLRAAVPGARALLAGSLAHVGDNEPSMLQAIQAHPDLFTLAGEVSEPEKIRLLNEASVFCSAASDETFCMAAMEAAAHGVPLALSDLPCYEGIWRHGVNALLAPVGELDVLAWNLRALLHDAALAARLGDAARRTSARFTRAAFLDRMTAVLQDAVADPLQRPGH